MLLNWFWTPIFFGFHQILIGLVVIFALLITAIVFILQAGDGVAR